MNAVTRERRERLEDLDEVARLDHRLGLHAHVRGQRVVDVAGAEVAGLDPAVAELEVHRLVETDHAVLGGRVDGEAGVGALAVDPVAWR